MATMCWTLRGGRFTSQELMWIWMMFLVCLLVKLRSNCRLVQWEDEPGP